MRVKYVFDDAESRIEGLQGKRLADDECALFVYGSLALPKFHMRNVPQDLWLTSVVGGVAVESYFMERGGEVYPLRNKTSLVVESVTEIPVGTELDLVGEELVPA